MNLPLKEKLIEATGFVNRIWANFFLDLAASGFVDRGDPSGYDKAVGDFTADAAWHDLDLSAIVPAKAKAIYLRITIQNDTLNESVSLRKNGNTDVYGARLCRCQVVNQAFDNYLLIPCDTKRVIEYQASNGGTWAAINFVVLGWFL